MCMCVGKISFRSSNYLPTSIKIFVFFFGLCCIIANGNHNKINFDKTDISLNLIKIDILFINCRQQERRKGIGRKLMIYTENMSRLTFDQFLFGLLLLLAVTFVFGSTGCNAWVLRIMYEKVKVLVNICVQIDHSTGKLANEWNLIDIKFVFINILYVIHMMSQHFARVFFSLSQH